MFTFTEITEVEQELAHAVGGYTPEGIAQILDGILPDAWAREDVDTFGGSGYPTFVTRHGAGEDYIEVVVQDEVLQVIEFEADASITTETIFAGAYATVTPRLLRFLVSIATPELQAQAQA